MQHRVAYAADSSEQSIASVEEYYDTKALWPAARYERVRAALGRR